MDRKDINILKYLYSICIKKESTKKVFFESGYSFIDMVCNGYDKYYS